MKRIVQPEFLDELPSSDPRAIRSRRDLRRINAWMGNYSIMARALQSNLNGHTPKQITELGAGDGTFLLRVAQKIAARWPDVNATLLDQKENVSPQTLAAFDSLGWHAEAVVADVFDWPQTECEIVIANLFLHHFEDAKLKELLQIIAQRAQLFIVLEPHRFRFPFPCAQLLRFIGCSKITLHDAEASIAGGFIRQEISALWRDKQNWQITERRAGLFSHLFIARKIV
ncbi:MAG: class I SAM-dependent methyltransferase [Limisphaerales bacterium]